MIDKAQDIANTTIDVVQEKVSETELSQINLSQFGDFAESSKQLMTSIQGALEIDLANQDAVAESKQKIANAYACLVDISSESTAEKIANELMSYVENDAMKTFIESSIQTANSAVECVTQ